MNKINNITENISVFKKIDVNKTNVQDTKSFKDIFNTEMEKQGISSSDINNLNVVENVSGVDEVQKTATEKLNKFLEMLGDYSDKLNDENNTLKELEPIINTIKEDAEALNNIASAMPENNRLKDIITESVMFANQEHFRFNRGDYL